MSVELRVKRLTPTATMPVRAHPRDAGLDLFADLGGEEAVVTIPVGSRTVISSGVAIAPPSFEGQTLFGVPVGVACILKEKSGLAEHQGISIMAGVCDEGFRNAYGVLVRNSGDKPLKVKHGQKICQLLVVPVLLPKMVEVSDLDETDRGEAGWGSTGR